MTTTILRPGRTDDPAWVRPALLALLAGTAVLYLWSLGDSGWANAYYSAAVQAATESWKAFFFGSSDAANSITVDKAPLFLWPMAIAARLFGVNSWSILVPQALEGVAAVGVLYLAVRRWAGAAAGLIAGAVLAVTPAAALMFRFNNPDAMLVLLLTLGAYATVRAIEGGATRWVVLAGACVGFGFLAKMLQAFLVLPGFGVAYLVAAPGTLLRRVRQLLVAGVSVVVSAGWWVAVVELWPASSRPYIGGSQENSVLELVFGYNGFGRLTGEETGSVGAGPAGTSGRWGPTGLGRLFNDSFGGQISWLLPAALILVVVLLSATWRAPRTDRLRAATLLWGGWLAVTGLAISLGQGIIHEYYTVALAPSIGALVGIGVVHLWRRRDLLGARAVLAGVIAATAWWASELLGRTPDWHAGLRPAIAVSGLAAAALVLVPMRRLAVTVAAGGLGLGVSMVGPVAYSWATVTTPSTGALPTAGPTAAGARGGPGGGPGRAPADGFPGDGAALAPPGGLGGNRQDGTAPPGAAGPGAARPAGGRAGARPGGGVGGILGASKPSDELVSLLTDGADAYRWVAAVVSANQAAGYQLATGEAVMPIGGFNGTDPSPTLEQFQQFVADGEIHWYISGGGQGPGGGSGTNEIDTWVQDNFAATTVDGVTLYDLT